MRKKLLAICLVTGLAASMVTGCQKESEGQTEQKQETQVQQTENNENASEDTVVERTTTNTCSLCEVEKMCGTYTAEGQEYIVCPECANEFVHAFSETADKQECSLCEEEKICGTYTVDGKEYVVCKEDYNEFAHGMNLND